MKRGSRRRRNIAEMVDRLETQLALLSDYATKAFDQGQESYIPEVASKLRLLVVRSRQNTPLLLEVASKLSIPLQVRLSDRPRLVGDDTPDEMSLDEYFDLNAVVVRISTGLVHLTKRELIRAWAQQLSGAHEDWAVDEALANAVRLPVYASGFQLSVHELRNCANSVLAHGADLVEKARKGLA